MTARTGVPARTELPARSESPATAVTVAPATGVAARDRKRSLDAIALTGIAMTFACVTLLWFLDVLEFDLRVPAWFVFGYATLYVLLAALGDRLEGARALERASGLLQLSLLPFFAVLWHLVGGVGNPMFLLVFFLPVAASGAILSRFYSYLIALFAALLVLLIAAAGSAGLRWQLQRYGLDLEAISAGIRAALPPAAQPFPGLELEPSFQLAAVAMFVVLLFTSALVAQSLTLALVRLASRLQASADHLAEVTSLFEAILRAEPEPGLVVYADSGQIVQASDRFLERMLLTPAELVGRTVFELVRFAEPERVRALLLEPSGQAPFCAYAVGAETRVANLTVHSVEHGTTAYAYIGFKEVTESYYLNAAFDAIAEPVLVISADGHLRYANRAAEDVFGALYFNLDLSDRLAPSPLPRDWWRQPSPEPDRRLSFNERPYLVSCTEVTLPGDPGGAIVITMRDVAEEERLTRQVSIDSLTGVYNRRHFVAVLPQQMAQATAGVRASLALLSLDRLQQLNDTLGRAAGDEALRRTSRAAQVEVQPAESIFRIGGNRFAVLFPDTPPHEAAIVIDRIHRRLGQRPLLAAGQPVPIDFASAVVPLLASEHIDSLMARADALLQSARESGRGQCLVEM